MTQLKPLTETIPYRRTVWMTGFVKTTLSSSLIATGVVLLFNGITNHPLFNGWDEVAIVTGALMILLAILIITSIDKWKEKTKHYELETIEKHIDEKAQRIAEEKIIEYMEKIENG